MRTVILLVMVTEMFESSDLHQSMQSSGLAAAERRRDMPRD